MQKKGEERDEGPSSHIPSSWLHEDGEPDYSKVKGVASRTSPPPRDKSLSENHPRLRPPPRLLNSSLASSTQDGHALQSLHHHHRKNSAVGQALGSYSFHKRRHQRGSSLDDDPFWLAMVACTNEGNDRSCKGGDDGSGRSTAGGGLVRMIQEHSLHFDQCMPRRTLSSTRSSNDQGKRRPDRLHTTSASVLEAGVGSTSQKGAQAAYNLDAKRGLQRAEPKVRRSTTVEHAVIKEGKPPVSARSVTADRHQAGSRSIDDIHPAGKALKALNISKAGFYSRCKDLKQQQSSVDLSCGHAKKLSYKKKIPDLFGCKSERAFQH